MSFLYCVSHITIFLLIILNECYENIISKKKLIYLLWKIVLSINLRNWRKRANWKTVILFLRMKFIFSNIGNATSTNSYHFAFKHKAPYFRKFYSYLFFCTVNVSNTYGLHLFEYAVLDSVSRSRISLANSSSVTSCKSLPLP